MNTESPKKPRVLILDDDPFVRSMVKNILEAGGFIAETAKDGREALHRNLEEKDLIISDMNMAGMNGLQFIKKIRKKGLETPVLLLTVNSEISLALEAVRCGASGYLLKDEHVEKSILIAAQKTLNMHNNEESEVRPENARLLVPGGRMGEPDFKAMSYSKDMMTQQMKRVLLPRTIKVLVVDDDSFVREMIGFMLESEGYDVETAENGLDALDKYKRNPDKHLVVSDMDMPEMDGMGLIEALRKTGTDVPVIILTGNSEVGVALQAIAKGANDYLLKDENIQDTILLAVEKVIEKYFLEKRVDSLLKNTLPESVAEEMKYRGKFAPRQYHCTILFSDFVQFTRLAETISDELLIKLLDELFVGFDDLIKHFDGTKIKTIGDAYMAVFGAPEWYETHAQKAVKAGMALFDFVNAFNRENSQKFQMRIGIHTGPVMAGVVGKERMQFDVFGDQVNIASRFETSGQAGGSTSPRKPTRGLRTNLSLRNALDFP